MMTIGIIIIWLAVMGDSGMLRYEDGEEEQLVQEEVEEGISLHSKVTKTILKTASTLSSQLHPVVVLVNEEYLKERSKKKLAEQKKSRRERLKVCSRRRKVHSRS